MVRVALNSVHIVPIDGHRTRVSNNECQLELLAYANRGKLLDLEAKDAKDSCRLCIAFAASPAAGY